MNGNSTARTAQLLLDRGDRQRAVAAVDEGVAAGDADAAFLSAIWRLVGDPVPRDLPRARSDLTTASEHGHKDAALMLVALTANGSGAPPDWRAAQMLLTRAAQRDPLAAAHLALINAMSLTAEGDPAAVPIGEVMVDDPRVVTFRRAFTAAECAHLAEAVTDIIAPSVVVDPATGRHIRHPIRNSDGAVIGPTRETLVITTLNRRLAAMTGTNSEQGEPIQVLRYSPGQEFRLHSDALPGADNQRIVTAITYLNDDFDGGETRFPALELTIAPRTGDTLVFHNVDANGQPHPLMRHAGMPVTHGVKWIATRWIRRHAHSAWNMGGA